MSPPQWDSACLWQGAWHVAAAGHASVNETRRTEVATALPSPPSGHMTGFRVFLTKRTFFLFDII